MKELLRTTDPTVIAWATALLAGEGIEGFAAHTNADPKMKQRALEAEQQYEEQIRSVLAV